MPSYLYRADQCPAIPVPTTALQNATSENPLVNEAIALGDSIALLHKSNRNAGRAEITGRYGSGAYAVLTGLGLSIGTGLNVVVAAGQALIDGPRTVTAPTNVAVPDSIALGSIWMTQAGALVASSTLASPGGNVALLGMYTSSGGSVTVVDESGVPRFEQGGFLIRRTADIGCPSDTPTAGVRFLNQCVGGLYFYTGDHYDNLTGAGIAALTFAGDADKTLLPAEYSNRLLSFAAGVGVPITVTRDVIVPLTPAGRIWTVRNNADGAQSIRVIGASGSGVTIATAKYAEVMADGTDILRVTPDT